MYDSFSPHNLCFPTLFDSCNQVRNVGAVIGGLSPEQLRLLPPESFQGITPSAVMSIPINNFQALKVQQLRKYWAIMFYRLNDRFNDKLLTVSH